MIKDGKIWFGVTDSGEELSIIPKMANRHGLICGATGTGKTVTLKVLAESFCAMGVPVFMADVKGDITGIMMAGTPSEDMTSRIERFGLDSAGFEFMGCPVSLWDIYGRRGVQLRTTISEMGPMLLSRVLDLNELQSGILSIIFKIADDNGLLLVDTKDLKAMLNYVSENAGAFAADYGKISPSSIGVIVRAVVALESEGGDIFFGEPALNIMDFLSVSGGKGVVNILDSSTLINNTKLYSTFLLWMMGELFERLPEVGDMERPKLVFFFDEAHLLFKDTPKALLEKIEQMVKLIRSKGVGIYFCTQNPKDIPDGVLSQLGNKIEHGLRAYTPADQKAVKAAALSFRENPAMNTYDTILNLGTGEAVVSCLGEDGIPEMAQKAYILPPQCSFGMAENNEISDAIKESLYYSKYANAFDPDSAYEFLMRRDIDTVALAEEDKRRLEEEKQAAKDAEKKEREEAKEAERQEREAQKAAEREEREAQKAAEREEREALKAAEKEKQEALKAAEKEKQAALKAAEKEKLEAQKALEKLEKEKQREEEKKKNEIKREARQVTSSIGRTIGRSMTSGYGSIGKQIGSGVGATLGRGLFDTLFKR